MEFYIQNYDFTTVYTLYITFLLSVSLSVFWLVGIELPFIQSYLKKLSFQLSPSDFAFKCNSDLNLDIHLVLLRRVRMKISTEDDAAHFSPAT
ncbi:hypothetical protein D1970_08480 [Mesobacillus zeae]|uniref:Uncharacterized protein n=1 Tax=Mesobacillus zeae TaxID=1917180 RepID=A0A398B6L5_9BACI|nr:hypothetical protein D1970_08480 [Mesobacillus zeae]